MYSLFRNFDKWTIMRDPIIYYCKIIGIIVNNSEIKFINSYLMSTMPEEFGALVSQ